MLFQGCAFLVGTKYSNSCESVNRADFCLLIRRLYFFKVSSRILIFGELLVFFFIFVDYSDEMNECRLQRP